MGEAAADNEDAAGGRGMHCIRCGYELAGLATPVCPECGRAFDPQAPRTYTRRPRLRRFVRRAARTAAVVTAIAVVVLGAAAAWLHQRQTAEQAAIARLKPMAGSRAASYKTAMQGPAWWYDRLPRDSWLTLEAVTAIDFGATRVTDDDLAWVGALSALEELSLNGTDVTDAGVRELRSLRRLRVLEVYGSDITDRGMATVGSLWKLERLDLFASDITDAGVAELARLSQLQELSLASTAVTDAGLVHLHGLKQLRRLDVSDTRVTPSGIDELRRQLPVVIVERW